MKESSITKVLNVWESENKIIQPSNKELALEVIDQIASLFSAGSSYYYILNFENLEMEFVNDGTNEVLGISPCEFSIQKLFELMHPEDLKMMHSKEQEAINFLLKSIPAEEIPLYKVVYLMRLKHSNGTYKTILHQAKVLNLSKEGKIQHAIGIHTDVSYLNIPLDHRISFISNRRPSYFSVVSETSMELIENSIKNIFTSREKEIIKRIAEGKNSNQIANLLFLSTHTVNTHKKNILKKSHCNNTSMLVAKCIRAGVI